MATHTISECLATLQVSAEDLQGCYTLDEEFSFIKKAYFKRVLVCHPDKGGDAAVFRTVHASFEALRDMYDKGRVKGSFVSSSTTTTMDETMWQEFADMPMQSYDYFYQAAEEDVPLYRVELAKSGHSCCKQTSKIGTKHSDISIGKGEIRCGSLDDISGGYGRWHHLQCWRVPSKIWLGLPNPEECDDPEMFAKALVGMNEVLLCGFSQLPQQDKDAFVEHVMDKDNWAALRKSKKKKNDAAIVASASTAAAGSSNDLVPEGYHVPREHFVEPVPEQNGAVAGALKGMTVVLTGIFPEVGGGKGLNLGVDKVESMIKRFGGRVTSSVSGKTDILVVGKEPGKVKVTAGEASQKCKLITLKDLKEFCEGASLSEVASKPLFISKFSAGYPRKGMIEAALGPMVIKNHVDSDDDRKSAAKRKALEDDGGKKPAAKKRKGKKAADPKKTPKAVEEKENVFEEEEEEEVTTEEGEVITCDRCGVVCTLQSWRVEETDEDFCADCREEGRGVPQRYGKDV